MANVFDKEPISFVDQNEQFPVLNEQVGLTYQQFKTLVENTNYLYNNMGLSSIEVGSVETRYPSPGSFSDTIIEHNIIYVNGKPLDTLDFLFNIPTPRISASLNTEIVDENTPTGMTLVTAPIVEQINNTPVTTGYEFEFYAKLPKSPMYYLQYVPQQLTEEQQAQARNNINAGTSNFSGYYKDILNAPTRLSQFENDINFITIDSVPTKTSQLENDSGFLTNANIPTKTSDLINDSGFINADTNSLTNYYLKSNTYSKTEIDDLISGINIDLSEYYTKSQTDNAIVEYVDPKFDSLALVSTTGLYTDLINAPTKLSEFTNDVGFLTNANIPTKTSQLENDSGFITISSVPTKLSQFENDSGYITNADIPTRTSDLENDSGFITIENIPEIPTKLSQLTNDTNFITNTVDNLSNYYNKEYIDSLQFDIDLSNYYTKQEVDSLIDNISIDLSDYYTKSETDSAIETSIGNLEIPTNLSQLVNDTNFVTIDSIPTRTSDLINDSGFITNTVNNLDNYYNKEYIDSLTFNTDLSNYYTKAEVDDLINTISIDLSDYYTKSELNERIAPEKSVQVNTRFLEDGSFVVENELNYGSVRITASNNTPLISISNNSAKKVSRLNYDYLDFINDLGLSIGKIYRSADNNGLSYSSKNNSVSFDFNDLAVQSDIPTKLSQLENDSGFITSVGGYVSYERNQVLTDEQKSIARDNINASPVLVFDKEIKNSSNAVENSAIYNRFNSVDSDINSATNTANNAYTTAQGASNTANNINSKLNSLTLVNNGDNSYTLKFTQDNVVVGTIDLPEDNYINSITQSLIDNNIIFNWVNPTSNYPNAQKTIDLKPYVYTAGSGISTAKISSTDNRNVVSVLLDSTDSNNKLFFNSTTGGLNVNLNEYATKSYAETYAKTYADSLINSLIDGAPETLDTLKEIADWIQNDETVTNQILSSIATNTNNIANLQQNMPTITLNGSTTTTPNFYAPTSAGTNGYFLMSNGVGNPTWAAIPSITIDSALSTTSTNAVQNKVVSNAIYNIINNAIRIANSSGGGSIGHDSISTLGGGAVGFSAKVSEGGAIGNLAFAGSGFSGGKYAQVSYDYNNGAYIDAIQLGTGVNSKEKTLQIYGDNIYDSITHTLTVQNAIVNGTNISTELSSLSSDISTNTTDIENLENNTTKIANSNGGGSIGNGASATSGFSGGLNAKSSVDSIQLGTGTNTQAKTLQIYNDNIYNANTHTLTVQNISLNNADLETELNSKQNILTAGNGIVIENNVISATSAPYEGNPRTSFYSASGVTTAGSSIKDSTSYRNYSDRTLVISVYLDHSKNGVIGDQSGVQIGVASTSANAKSACSDSSSINPYRVARATSNSGYPKFFTITAFVPPMYYFAINWWGCGTSLNTTNNASQIRFTYL